MKQKICDLASLSELSCKQFTVKSDLSERDAFLIYFQGQCYAYENSCPHTGVNLNWQEEQFFSVDGLYLQCSLHGALFQPANGACIYGPCKGQNLKRLGILIENNAVFVA